MTTNTQNQAKAVALISGGLDSMLAARVVKDQGVHVEGLNFFTGFCVEGHTHAIRNHDRKRPKRNNALWVAEQLGIKLHIVDVIEEYKDQLPAEDVTKIKEKITEVREALTNKDSMDPEEIKKTVNDLQQSSLKLFEMAYKKMASERSGSSDSSSGSSEPSNEEKKEDKQ